MSTEDSRGDAAGWQPPSDPPPATPPPQFPPPGGGYGGPNPTYAGGYGYSPYVAPQTEGTAIGALVAAIAAWVACPVIPAIVALVLASTAKRKIAQSGGRLTGEGLVTASKWIAWINIGLFGVAAVFGILVLVIAGVAGMGTSEFQFERIAQPLF